MQNYNQAPQGYQRPGSTTSFTGQTAPPPPPGYGGYQSAGPAANSQWAAPAPSPAVGQQQWNQTSQQGNWGQQPQQTTGGYNPGTYGAMPAAYGQTQQQSQPPPPPPPPKPQGFAAAVQAQGQSPAQPQQSSQNWGQPQGQQAYQAAQQDTPNAAFTQQGQHGTYQQQPGGFQNQGAPQQQYSATAPPPPSQTPGGSYFPPQGRPGSIYGADQAGAYSTPSPMSTAQQQPSTVMSPDEQHPAYIPPSLSGQGVTSYMPANTNPMPGVYVPPPPDIPAWQQATHAPLQGGTKKFRYTKPVVDPSFHAQGYQSPQPMQSQQPQNTYGQPAHAHGQHQGHMQPGQFVQPSQPLDQQFSRPVPPPPPPPPPPEQFQQQHHSVSPQAPPPPQQYTQTSQGPQTQNPAQQYQQGAQWQPSPPVDPYGGHQSSQQQGWQAGHHAQGSVVSQQYPQSNDTNIQAPKPLGRTDTSTPGFVNTTSPETQPVSPVDSRQSMNFNPSHSSGRTASISSITQGSMHNQQSHPATQNSSPSPSVTRKALPPLPPTATGSGKAFSALGQGGPSDWERFANVDEEIDDEDMFGAKKVGTSELPAQLDSVELPASQPSPPSTVDEWPTPENQTAQPAPPIAGIQRRDTYQPTPPPNTGTPVQRPPSQAPQQGFVMDESIVVASQSPQPGQFTKPPPPQSFVMEDVVVSTQSPQPSQFTQPPPPQQGFVMDEANRVPSKQGTPVQQHHAPPPAQQGFVMDDGGWAAQSQPRRQTPLQHQIQPPPSTNTFVMGNGGWDAAEQTPTQASAAWGGQAQNDKHVAELKAKDDAYERLKADAEKQKAELRSEIDKLKADIEAAKNHSSSEKNLLNEQIDSMRLVADQAKRDADASASIAKERDMVVERLKEDGEGKDDLIIERDAIIADLKRQLEAEKTKEPPKPTPADLIPDIDPWYAGSLERYISMLRSEANAPQVEEKIKVFTGFLAAESAMRGLEYYSSAPPAPPVQETVVPAPKEEPAGLRQGMSNASIRKQEVHVNAPQQTFEQDDFAQYSPGGRPLLPRTKTFKANESAQSQQVFVQDEAAQYSPGGRPLVPQPSTLKSDESVPSQQSFAMTTGHEQAAPASNQSTAILTPTSSVDDEFNKTPIQSPPEEQPKPQYKAYVPSAATSVVPEPSHRHSVSFVAPPSIVPLPSKNPGTHDEIFFAQAQPVSKPVSRPTASESTLADDPVPAPLSLKSHNTAAALSPKKSPLETLAALLPKQISLASPNPRLQEIRKQAGAMPSDFTYIQEITTKWEKAAALIRKKNDDARRKRQEESEARTDELFNDNEISYADIGAIEDEFKEKERQLKAQEDRDEYKTYVEEVFDTVYDGLQTDIKSLMDLYMEAESLLHMSVSGTQALEGGEAPTSREALEVLKELHAAVEVRHDKVIAAVAERDKRYKKTEVQPLYAAGNIAKMKAVEKHFENAEKQAAVRAKGDKAGRIGELVRLAEEVVVRAVGDEQREADAILAAVKALNPADTDAQKEELLTRARGTLRAIKDSSKALLALFNALELDLNSAVLEAEMAQAKADNADKAKLSELEKELSEGEKKLKEEFERRVGVLERDWGDVEIVFQGVGGAGVEDEQKRRMRTALEEARRRNGEV